MKIKNLIILFQVLFFSIIVGSGFYGYGNDYYVAYYKSNLDWGNWFDQLGWTVSTFTIYDLHLGVYLVSFMLAYSTSFLIKVFFENYKLNSNFIFFVICLISFHTWPIIMSTSNAMKQGLCMSMIFLSLSFLLKNEIKKSFLFIFFSIFFHKTGIFFFTIYLLAMSINYFLSKFDKKINYLYILCGLVFAYFFYIIIPYLYVIDQPSRIIRNDYRLEFFMINFLFIIFFSIKNLYLKKNYILFLYMYAFISNSVLFNGLNWQYERLNMMMTIPFIMSVSFILTRRSIYIAWIILFLVLLIITIKNGMYLALF